MRKGNVRIYDFNNDGEYELHQELNKKQYIKKSKSLDFLEEDTVQAKDLKDELYSNPFLVRLNVFNRNYITNIEDFYIQIGDNYFTFGSIIRGSSFSKREKKKIAKNQIKYWIDEAEDEIESTIKGSKETISIGYTNNYLKIKFIHQFLLGLGIIIPIILLLNIIPIFNCKNNICIFVGIGIILLSIIGLILTILQNLKSKNYKNKIDEHKRIHNQYSSKIIRKFKRNKRRLSMYYSFGYSSNRFKKNPYPITKVQISADKLKQIQKSSQEIDKQSKLLLNKKEVPNFKYYVSIVLSYLCCGTCVTYILVNIIIYMIKLML